MKPVYVLRAARLADLPQMMAIGHEGLRPHIEALGKWDAVEQARGFVEHFTLADVSIVQVACTRTGDLQSAGYFKLMAYADHLFLDGIYLSAAHRSSGIGSAIIGDLITRAGREAKPLRLRVLRSNPARELYARLGFRCTDETDRVFLMEYSA